MVPVTRSVRRGIRPYRGPEPSFVNHVCRYGASLDGWLSSANSSRAAIPLGFSLPPRSAHHEIGIPLPAFGGRNSPGPRLDQKAVGAQVAPETARSLRLFIRQLREHAMLKSGQLKDPHHDAAAADVLAA